MSNLSELVEDLIIANRILSFEGVVDAYGHVSVRHPNDPNRFFLSRARTPQCIETDDIMEFKLDGAALDPHGRTPYLERFIHAAMYEARADVNSVVHSHSRRALVWVGAAGFGVVLVTQPWRGDISLVGVGYAGLAAVGWAAYIVLTQRVGDRFSGLSGLALTVPIAACTAAIIGIPQAAGHLTLAVVGAAVGLAILLPVVPYSFELLALRRMTPTAFGTLMALEPAIGVVLGILVLHQTVSGTQVIGILLVVVAGAAAQRGGLRRPSVIDGADAQPSTGPVPF